MARLFAIRVLGVVFIGWLSLGGLFAQTAPQTDSTRITIQIASPESGIRFELWEDALYYTPFQQAPVVARGETNKEGIVAFGFPVRSSRYSLSSPVTGLIRLYLYPGQNLAIQAPSDGADAAIFSGDHADDQRILNDLSLYIRRNRPRPERNIQPSEFLDQLLDFRQALEEEINEHCARSLCENQFRNHLEAFADAHIAAQRRMVERAGLSPQRPDFSVESVLDSHSDHFRHVPELIELAVAPVMDSMFVRFETDPSLELDQKGQARYKLDVINRGPDDFRRPTLYAAVLAQYFSLDGASDFGVQLLDTYRKLVDPQALSMLEALYARSESLIAMEVPDTEFQLPSGDPVRVSDFRGKVIYLDVWATWCAPCFTQLPYAKELETYFEDVAPDEVVFLNISVDEEANRWKSLIRDNARFGGIQVVNPEGWEGTFVDDLYIIGLPRYILLDRAGRMVLPYAPPPSSLDDVKAAITALL